MNAIDTIEGGAPLTLDFVNANASVLRWDYLAATMFDAEHHDAYLDRIESACRIYTEALFDAQYEVFQPGKRRSSASFVAVRARMVAHRARLQFEKATAFAYVHKRMLDARNAS